MTETEITDLKKNIKNVSTGSLQCRYNKKTYYLVYDPTGINDWTIVGIIHNDVVNASMRRIQFITIVLILILNGCIALILIGTVFVLMDSRLRMKEHEQMILLKRKELTEQMFSGLGRIVDRFAVGDLKNNRYEYHENLLKHPIYPETGYYDDLVKNISRQYLVMTDTENKKMNHLLTPDYLRCVLKKEDDIFKIEYYNRSIDTYLVMHVVPVEWDSEHELEKVMLIAQDIGQKHELENLANTDGLTGLYNERYFNSILHKKELQKLPFILFYLDLDHFKSVNDTYGHDMGDKLLKEAANRLQSCIRSNDYAFRIGGDEFSLVVCTEFDESLCCRIKEQIQNQLCAPFDIDGKTLYIGSSCGYAAYPNDASTANEIRILADQRMYAEKEKHHMFSSLSSSSTGSGLEK